MSDHEVCSVLVVADTMAMVEFKEMLQTATGQARLHVFEEQRKAIKAQRELEMAKNDIIAEYDAISVLNAQVQNQARSCPLWQ